VFGDAIDYPRSSENWLITTLIGGACFIFSFFILR